MKSYYHRGGNIPLQGSTIAEHFSEIAARFPKQEAVVSLVQHKRLTYSALSDEIEQLAKGLLAIGFAKGDRIGIWSTNNIEWLLLQMATARIGAVLVNINPAYHLHELAYALNVSEVQGVFTIPAFHSNNYVAMLVELLPELKLPYNNELGNNEFPFLRKVVVYDPADTKQTSRCHDGFMTWPEVIKAGNRISTEKLNEVTASLDRDDPINIQYTSGTTGFPKAVILTHHNILNNAWFAAQAMHFSEQDRLCVPVPLLSLFRHGVSKSIMFICGCLHCYSIRPFRCPSRPTSGPTGALQCNTWRSHHVYW